MKPRISWNGRKWVCETPGGSFLRLGEGLSVRDAFEAWKDRVNLLKNFKGEK